MTVSATTTSNGFTGNGSTQAFAFTFRAMADSWVKVTVGGVLQVTGYTVARSANQDSSPGGTVTFTVPPALNAAILIYRATPRTQLTALPAYGPFPSATMERALDAAVMQVQDLTAEVSAGDVAGQAATAVVAADLAAETARAVGAEAALGRSISQGSAGGNDTLVTATGSSTASTARTLATRAADVFNVMDYGGKGDGITDETAAVLAAIAAAQAAGGGTVFFPAKPFVILGQLTFASSGSPTIQKPVRFVGSGLHMSGQAGSPPAVTTNGGTVLDMRYAGSYGKILTVGAGFMEFTGIQFTDTSGGTTPWIYTTGTTLHVHGNSFIGSKQGILCDQDCIVLGGTVEAFGNADPTHGFQGYGTVIRDNYFDHVRRAVWLRTYANGVVVQGNTIWADCGSNLANGAAFDFQGSSGSGTATGNFIAGNIIEVSHYPYAFSHVYSQLNTFIGNGVYDHIPGVTLGVHYYGAGAASNLNISTLHEPVVPISNLAGSFNYNTSLFDAEPLKLGFQFQGAAANPLSLYAGTTNDSAYIDFFSRSASPTTRTGLIGCPTTGSNNFQVQADAGLLFLTSQMAGGYVASLQPLVLPEAITSPAAGNFTINANTTQIASYNLATAAGTWTPAITNGVSGAVLTVTIRNTSAGGITVTWPVNAHLAGAWVNPAAGTNRSIGFRLLSGVWVELWRTAADVPN